MICLAEENNETLLNIYYSCRHLHATLGAGILYSLPNLPGCPSHLHLHGRRPGFPAPRGIPSGNSNRAATCPPGEASYSGKAQHGHRSFLQRGGHPAPPQASQLF